MLSSGPFVARRARWRAVQSAATAVGTAVGTAVAPPPPPLPGEVAGTWGAQECQYAVYASSCTSMSGMSVTAPGADGTWPHVPRSGLRAVNPSRLVGVLPPPPPLLLLSLRTIHCDSSPRAALAFSPGRRSSSVRPASSRGPYMMAPTPAHSVRLSSSCSKRRDMGKETVTVVGAAAVPHAPPPGAGTVAKPGVSVPGTGLPSTRMTLGPAVAQAGTRMRSDQPLAAAVPASHATRRLVVLPSSSLASGNAVACVTSHAPSPSPSPHTTLLATKSDTYRAESSAARKKTESPSLANVSLSVPQQQGKLPLTADDQGLRRPPPPSGSM
mmetsp:Transcript_2935/g.9653  ORF Transcript_2935/g.9653 Transcript_2935/m.9653 type:complete len:327 (-) Transcript_2935:1410-2390(-)